MKWNIEHVSGSGGYVRIKSVYSNLYIGVNSSNTSQIKQYSTQNDYTLWKIDRSDVGNLIFRCKATESSNKVLTVPSTNTNGTDLTQATYNGNDSDFRDEWNIRPYDAAMLMAIDDVDNADRHLYFESTKGYLRTENDGKVTVVTTDLYTHKTVSEMIEIMQANDVFVVQTHGSQHGFKISNNSRYFDMTDLCIFDEATSTVSYVDLSNLDLAILLTCGTAVDYSEENIENNSPVNIVEQMVLCGAEAVVGFEDTTYVSDCDKLIESIVELMVNHGCSISEALGMQNEEDYDFGILDVYVIAGNPDKTIR